MEKSWGIFIQPPEILSFDLGQPTQWGGAETRVLPKAACLLSLLGFCSSPSPSEFAEPGTKLQAGAGGSDGLGFPYR